MGSRRTAICERFAARLRADGAAAFAAHLDLADRRLSRLVGFRWTDGGRFGDGGMAREHVLDGAGRLMPSSPDDLTSTIRKRRV